jgi:uncharacterized protein
MQRTPNGLRYSSQDLILYVNSDFASWMDRFALDHPDRAPQPSPADEMQTALYTMGQQHEQQYLKQLQTEGRDIAIINSTDSSTNGSTDGVTATLAAM